MLDASLDWLEALPDLRVTGVTGVTAQPVGLSGVTPPDLDGVTGVTKAAELHPLHPAENRVYQQKPPQNGGFTPVTPVTPQNDHPVEGMAAIEAGLIKLRGRRPPKLTRPNMWAGVVLDAVQIHSQGWAEKALGLGWSILDLYGIGKDSHDFAGLAVWLEGRKMLMLDADRAVASDHNGRHHFNRGTFGHGSDASALPVPIWEFGL